MTDLGIPGVGVQSPTLWWGSERCSVWPALELRLVVLSMAGLVEFGHSGFGEVAAGNRPFVILFP